MTKLTKEHYQVGYFLSRCGSREDATRSSLPPPHLNVKSWTRAYDIFFSKLSMGRTLSSFRNTLKNARDLFDGHFDNGRVGWKERSDQELESRKARPLTGLARQIFYASENLGDEQLWTIVAAYADLQVARIDPRILSNLAAELEPNEKRIQLRTEGGRRVVVSTRAERNPSIRAAAIKQYGTKCMVCGFSFEAAYGEWGKGFIEVHHLHLIRAPWARSCDEPPKLRQIARQGRGFVSIVLK